MSLPRPSAHITLNGQRLSAAEAGLVGLRVDLAFNSHDTAHLLLWPRSKLAVAEPGMDLTIGLGLNGDGGGPLATAGGLLGAGGDAIWTGGVQGVRSRAGYLAIEGLASTAQLSRERRSLTWADQTVADIVRDLVGDLDSEIEADLDLPNYSIDNRRSVWAHLCELARLAGAQLSGAPEGGVRFILESKETALVELRYGTDLIDWWLSRREVPAATGAVEQGAASSAGSDKWHWLAHDPVGSGGEVIAVPAAFRTRAAADKFAAAISARAQRSGVRGAVWLGGRPDLRPGALVELKDLPEGDSGPLRVRAVTHQLDGETGLITALAVEAGGGSAGGLP
jgi:hypothetical protein